MEHAGTGLEQMLIGTFRRMPRNEAPLLAWPLVCDQRWPSAPERWSLPEPYCALRSPMPGGGPRCNIWLPAISLR